MDDTKVQQAWTQAATTFSCGKCKAARLLVWEKVKGSDPPHQATAIGDCWVALHCDYFRRRIESPAQLQRCGAFQTRDEGRKKSAG